MATLPLTLTHTQEMQRAASDPVEAKRNEIMEKVDAFNKRHLAPFNEAIEAHRTRNDEPIPYIKLSIEPDKINNYTDGFSAVLLRSDKTLERAGIFGSKQKPTEKLTPWQVVFDVDVDAGNAYVKGHEVRRQLIKICDLDETSAGLMINAVRPTLPEHLLQRLVEAEVEVEAMSMPETDGVYPPSQG